MKVWVNMVPVIPDGGITTLPNSPCGANNCRISLKGVAAGRFLTSNTVFDRLLGG